MGQHRSQTNWPFVTCCINKSKSINSTWKILGADVSFEYPVLGQIIPQYTQNFLKNLGEMGHTLDVVTYHFYPLLSYRCLPPILPDPWIATTDKYLEPRVLNKVRKTIRSVIKLSITSMRTPYNTKILRYSPKIASAVREFQEGAQIW